MSQICRLSTVLFACLMAAGGCASDPTGDQVGGAGERADAPAELGGAAFEDELGVDLAIPLSESPDSVYGQGTAFDSFCANPVGGFNLNNAAWLAYWSANEYSHLSAVGPVLSDLGFGQAGDIFWSLCGRDLRQLMDKEDAGEIPAEIGVTEFGDPSIFGTCARDWFEDAYGAPSVGQPIANVGDLADRFKHYLIQNPGENSKIQFFSGGKFTVSATGVDFEKGSTQAFWAEHSEKPVVIVSFRGTEPNRLEDIGADLTFWQEDLDEYGWGPRWGDMHKGFLKAYLSIEDGLLMERLRELEGTGVGIWITGHSLGGALATVFAARIFEEMDKGMDLNLRGVYTFGSPRVGDSDFVETFDDAARRYNTTVARVRNDDDIVTQIPKLLMGYRHVDQHVYLTEDGDLEIEPTFYGGPLASVFDHSSLKYYAKLKALLGNAEYTNLNRCAD